ncbi:GPI transamidase component [Coemansia erecta]|nr:GPI transamidase component [Coemansia sp. RSA 2618]KAJ2821171.1 GPI transamidase component [Coemansia erecta]
MAVGDRLRALFARRAQPKTVISVHRERQVAVCSILLFLLLGLPLWWTTTRVYRADLPASDITQFAPGQTLPVPVVFYIDAKAPLSQADTAFIQEQAQSRVDSQRPPYAAGEWRIRYQATVHAGVAPDAPGHYTLRLRTGSGSGSALVDVGPDRSAVVSVARASQAKDVLVQAISAITAGEERSARDLVPQAGKAVKYAPEYAITLTLLNEDPVDGAAVDWDIEQAVRAYLQPLVDELRPFTRLSVSSQVLHHAGPPPVAVHRTDNGTYLTHDMLPHFVNSPSWNFASVDPTAPMLNFVLFVPALASQPMHIRGVGAEHSSAFLVSQWGGVSIANLPDETRRGDSVVLSQADLQQHMGYFISQIRSLVGIRSNAPLTSSAQLRVRVRPAAATGVSGWELDSLMRRWLLHNRQTAISTLQSLVRLVDSMQNMVVMDGIKDQVDQSLAALHDAESALAQLSPLKYTHAFARAAAAASLAESAFFDPSMVSMLYFPDQHKYAIYMPFFLPATLPLLAALKKIFAEKRRSKSAAKVPSKVD